MKKEEAIKLVSSKIKLIRTEMEYSQEKMAEITGVSKKTLIQIEKDRALANWTHTVAVCALFRHSEILQATLGEEPLEVIEIIAHDGLDRPKNKTIGGRIWWKDLKHLGRFRLQQNLISQHFRILDDIGYRWYSSFELEKAKKHLEELAHENA